MSNFEERFLLPASNLIRKKFIENELKKMSRQEILAHRLEIIATEMRTIPYPQSFTQAMSIQATIEFIERLDAIKYGRS